MDKKPVKILNDILLYSFMALYALILFALLLFRRYSHSEINLVPFHSIYNFLWSGDRLSITFALDNILGNIVIFIPLGVYFSLFFNNKKIYVNTLYVALASVVFEALQFLLKVGVSDIDDVILNTLGGFIGVCLYRLLLVLMKEQYKARMFVGFAAPVAAALCFLILIFR